MAHGFTETYDMDYKGKFSKVVWFNSACNILSLAIN